MDLVTRSGAEHADRPRTTRESLRAPGARVSLILVAVETLICGLPYLVLGPTFLVDDWLQLRNQRFSGVWAGAGHAQALARPGAWLTFNLLFGIIGDHPLVFAGVLLALNAILDGLLCLVLRRFLSPTWALMVTVVHVFLPIHGSLSRWPSTVNITVGLILVLAGAVMQLRGHTGRAWLSGLVAMGCGGLCYEALLPAAAGLLVAVEWRGERRSIVRVGSGLVALGGVGTWMLVRTQRSLGSPWAPLSVVPQEHFGLGLSRFQAAAITLSVIAGLGGVMSVFLATRRPKPWRQPLKLLIAGWTVIALGTLPFLKFPLDLGGLNDRTNVVSSIGSALVWTGVGAALTRLRLVFVLACTIFLSSVSLTRGQQDRAYANAGRIAADALARVANDAPGTSVTLVEPRTPPFDGIAAINFDWDASAAYQLRTGDPTVMVRLERTGR